MQKSFIVLGMALTLSACQSNATFPEEQISSDVVEISEDNLQERNNPSYVNAFGGDYGLEYRSQRQERYEAKIDPLVYALVARRTVNKMLDDTSSLYEEDHVPLLYVRNIKMMDKSLPKGFYKAHQETVHLLENSKTFRMTDDKYEADYILATEVDTLPSFDSDGPVIEYRLVLLNHRYDFLKEWTENIRQVTNDDRSWW